MRMRQDNFLPLYLAIFTLTAIWSLAWAAHAAKPTESSSKTEDEKLNEYEVKAGDTLGGIAVEHGVSLTDLMEINSVENADRVFVGVKLRVPSTSKNARITKQGVVVEVPKGFNLSKIAAAYEVPVAAIVKANKLSDPNHLREGQKILIPGASKIAVLVPPPPCFKDPVTLYRVRNDVSEQISLCFCNGKPNPEAVDALSKIAAPVHGEVPFALHERLVVLLQKVADRYPGKRIEIISGQRLAKQKGHETYHSKGQALDFRIQDVPNRQLVTFIRGFGNVGAGYYPNSVFIHMDTREESTYWVDYSKPGEKAIYGRKDMSDKEVEAIRQKRIEKTIEQPIAEAPEQTVAVLIQTEPTAEKNQENLEVQQEPSAAASEPIEEQKQAPEETPEKPVQELAESPSPENQG